MGANPTPLPAPRLGITSGFERITPQVATAWLEGNTHNRAIRDDHVAALARDMAAGRWHQTGDAIKFDRCGVLADGQHRLWAIVESGVTVHLLVVRGLEPDAQEYMDIGRKRSTIDALHLRGRGEYASRVSSIARGVLLMQHPGKAPTQGEILALVEAEEHLLVAGARMSRAATTAGLRGGAIYGAGYYFLAHVPGVELEVVDRFFGALVSGEQLTAGNPILALRRRFMQAPPRVGSSTSHLRVNLAYIFKAWNAWRDGRSLLALRYTLDEPMPEAH